MKRVYKAPISIGNFVVRDGPPCENGLFVVDDAGNETGISDPIWHLGNVVRAGVNGASDASDIVEFLDRNGVLQETIIPHEDALNHPSKVFEKLARCNFAVPELVPGQRNQPRRNLLTSYLAECRRSPAKKYLLADRMGWHVVDDDWSFVIGSEVISADPSKGLKLSGPISQHLAKFGQHGTLDQYKENVLRRASYSSRLMTGIALALLAPLMRILNLDNGGLHIFGKRGMGKTTAYRVAGSFMAAVQCLITYHGI